MSACNGCRVLRKACNDNCELRQCLHLVGTPQAQANGTAFVAKYFGRVTLMSFISSTHQDQRPAMFESLLYEAVGRTVNPVGGAVGLLGSGKWHVCQAAVERVLRVGASGLSQGLTAGGATMTGRRRFKKKPAAILHNYYNNNTDKNVEGQKAVEKESAVHLNLGSVAKRFRTTTLGNPSLPDNNIETATAASRKTKVLKLFI